MTKLESLPPIPKMIDGGAAFVPGGHYLQQLREKRLEALEARLKYACELLESFDSAYAPSMEEFIKQMKSEGLYNQDAGK